MRVAIIQKVSNSQGDKSILHCSYLSERACRHESLTRALRQATPCTAQNPQHRSAREEWERSACCATVSDCTARRIALRFRGRAWDRILRCTLPCKGTLASLKAGAERTDLRAELSDVLTRYIRTSSGSVISRTLRYARR